MKLLIANRTKAIITSMAALICLISYVSAAEKESSASRRRAGVCRRGHAAFV